MKARLRRLLALAVVGAALAGAAARAAGGGGALAVALFLLGGTVAAIAWWRLERRLASPLARLVALARRPSPERGAEADRKTDLGSLLAAAADRLETLQAESGELAAILASMAEGVALLDGERRTLYSNAAFRRFFGAPEGGGLGEPPGPAEESLGAVAGRLEVAELLARAAESGRSQQGEIRVDRPQRRRLSLTVSPVEGGDGFVLVARDVTGLERLHEVRRDFVANVSHELKTPLTAIRGYAETLAAGALDSPDTARSFTARILGQCERLEGLLRDLLTLSRLESADAAWREEPVELARLVEQALEVVAGAAREKDVRLEAASLDRVEIRGDSAALEQLVLNLLDNAVKYNRPGGSVSVALDREGNWVTLEVRDTGIGIPPASLPRLFERFYRVDKGRSRQEGGTGLGLAIVKHVAGRHGGEVEVTSTLGTGSRFRVRLPVGPAVAGA